MTAQKIVDVAWSGASKVTPLPLPDYPPLQPYFDAVKDLLETVRHAGVQPGEGRRPAHRQGLEERRQRHVAGRDRRAGQARSSASSTSPASARSSSRLLKRGGIDSSYSEPPDFFDHFSAGNFTGALFGHGGSCREPQETLALYQSSSEAIPGGHAVNFSRWNNPEFDKLADEAYVTAPD